MQYKYFYGAQAEQFSFYRMPVMRYPPDIQKRSRCPAAQTGFKVGIKMAKMLTEMWNGHRFCIAWTGKNCMGLWTA